MQLLAYLQHGRVFHRGGHDVAPAGVGLGGSEDGRVVALSRAGGEEDLLGVDVAEGASDLCAGLCDGVRRVPGGIVHRAGVEIVVRAVGGHGLADFRGNLRSSVIVGVDDSHASTFQ